MTTAWQDMINPEHILDKLDTTSLPMLRELRRAAEDWLDIDAERGTEDKATQTVRQHLAQRNAEIARRL